MIWVNGKYEIEERNINKKDRYKEIRLGWHGETSGLSYIEILNIINSVILFDSPRYTYLCAQRSFQRYFLFPVYRLNYINV